MKVDHLHRSSERREGLLLAIDVGGTKTNLGCYDTSTGLLCRAQVNTHVPGLTGPRALLRLLGEARQCGQVGAGRPLLGVAAVFPGVVYDSRLLLAPNVSEFDGIDLRKTFTEAFAGAAVVFGNDVKAGALAEHEWGHLAHCDHALYLNIGTGLAGAAIINGAVHGGSHGAALEIGCQRIAFIENDRTSQPARAQEESVSLETVFSGASLDRLAQKLLGPMCSARDLFGSTQAQVQHELHRRIDALALHLVNLFIALDVEKVAIGGGVSRQYAVFAPRLMQLLQRRVPFPPSLVMARFALDAPLWGALEMARRAAGVPMLPDRLFVSQPGA